MRPSSICPVVCVFFVTLAPIDARGNESAQRLAALFSTARSAYAAKDFEASNAAYLEYLKLLPKKSTPIDSRRSKAHYGVTLNYVQLGDKPKAYEHLGEAIDNGKWNTAFLERDPSLQAIRGTKEFRELIDGSRKAPGRLAFGRTDLTGKTIDAKDYKGKVLLIDVWGTWCPPCRQLIPHLVELQEKYRDNGFEIIGAAYEKVPPSLSLRREVGEFAKTMGVNYRCTVVDTELVNTVPVAKYPTMIFVDHEGNVAQTITSYQPFTTLERHVVKLLNKKIRAEYDAKKRDGRTSAEGKGAAGKSAAGKGREGRGTAGDAPVQPD